MDGVSCGKNGGSGVEGANDTDLGYGYSLLLHSFVKDHTSVVVHLVELVNATDTSVRKDKCTTLKDQLTRLWIPGDVHGETNG